MERIRTLSRPHGRPRVRSGNLDDNVTMNRVIVDHKSNRFGDSLLEFVNDSNMCIVNGRFDRRYDNYTCISRRGCSVVDYILVPRSQLCHITDFHVTTMTDALDKYSITPNAHAKIPDHSFVSCSLTLTQIQDCHTERNKRINGGASSSEGNQGEPVHRRYRTNMMPAHMFSNDRCVRCLNDVIDSMTDRAIQQNDIDHTYTELVAIIHDEMDNNLSYKDYSPGKMRRTKRNKPFWNDNLSELCG